jgi:hypothetical protein
MHCKPTTKELTAEFRDLSDSDAELIRALCVAVDDCSPQHDALQDLIDNDPRLHATERYVRSLHSSPYYVDCWRVTVALHAIDTLIGTCGVEGFGPERSGDYAPAYEYCNAGDPYVATLIFDRDSDELFVGCWGDIAEQLDPNDCY